MQTQGVVTVNGKVSSPQVEERVLAYLQGVAGGSVVSNLELPIPAAERQILLRVRFLEVQRTAIEEFGLNLISTGATNTIGSLGTQQFGSVRPTPIQGTIPAQLSGTNSNFSLTDTLNIFAIRPDLNLAAAIKMLQTRALAELLAEPNVITTSGKQADLLVGGEFPVPIVQGGAGAGAVTVQFREFGIRISFLPEFTPRGSIQMHVEPELSTLDFANAVQLSGFVIPALSTRRVTTDVELMPGQSFVIGGLIDNRSVENFNRIPGPVEDSAARRVVQEPFAQQEQHRIVGRGDSGVPRVDRSRRTPTRTVDADSLPASDRGRRDLPEDQEEVGRPI